MHRSGQCRVGSGYRMPENGNREETNKPRAAGRASVAAVQIEALLATLDAASEASERAEIFVDIARRFRDDLGDNGQAIDALLEAWKTDPTQEAILEVLEPLVHAESRWSEV